MEQVWLIYGYKFINRTKDLKEDLISKTKPRFSVKFLLPDDNLTDARP